MVLESIPNRPLQRREIDALGEADAIDGIFPIYGEQPELRDTAIGVVIKIGETAHGIAYDEQDGWETVEKRSVSPGDGFAFHETEILEELFDALEAELPVDSESRSSMLG